MALFGKKKKEEKKENNVSIEVKKKNTQKEREAEEKARLAEALKRHNERARQLEKLKDNEEVVVEEKDMAVEKKPAKTGRKYNGKIIVYKDGENYRYVLKASNGELLCTSETYVSKQSIGSAIETLKNNVENGVFSVYEDKHGRFQYLLNAKNNRIIIVGEIYTSRNNCINAIESVKKFATTADIVYTEEDIKEHYNILEENFDANEVESAPNGKIEVLEDDGKFYYVLKASNGVLLFTSKTFSSQKTCLANIDNFKQLLSLNNFKIYMDKNKIFVFKIYNKVNALMIVGEHYDSLAKCKSALTSVIRFGKEAKIIE